MQQASMTHHNSNHKDPLMKKARKSMAKFQHDRDNITTPPSERIFQLSALTVTSFLVYLIVLLVTIYTFFRSPGMVIMFFCIVVGLNVMVYLLVEYCTRRRDGKWKKWIGLFNGVAACAALFVGLGIHYEYMLFYFKYTNMMKYSNVAASQPALQFQDAGSLLFTEGTTVDRTRSVGFRNIRTSQTLCVAPVVDGQMQPNEAITFYAVGTGCCGWRANFNCDDAAKGGTRGGLLLLEPNQLVSPAMEWMVDEQVDFEGYEKAIKLAEAVFDVSPAKDYRLLRWVQDPTAAVDHYRLRGLEMATLSCVAFLIIAGFNIFNDVVQENRRQAAMAKQFMKGGGGNMA